MNNWVILWKFNKEKLFPRGKLALRSKMGKKSEAKYNALDLGEKK